MKHYTIEESPFSYFLTASTKSSPFWLVARIYLGWMWLEAGWDKLHNPAWVGAQAGKGLAGFIQGALTKTGGAHPDVQGWYADFLTNVVLPHVNIWSYAVAWGELLVGVALIVGFLVGLSAFFGVFMNLNFMLAGTVSVNPIMALIAILLIVAWRVAGYLGLDYFVLPRLHRYFRPRIR